MHLRHIPIHLQSHTSKAKNMSPGQATRSAGTRRTSLLGARCSRPVLSALQPRDHFSQRLVCVRSIHRKTPSAQQPLAGSTSGDQRGSPSVTTKLQRLGGAAAPKRTCLSYFLRCHSTLKPLAVHTSPSSSLLSSPCALHAHSLIRSSALRSIGSTAGRGSRETSMTSDLAYPSFPYSDTDVFGFDRCKNPTQLEKSIESYLKSHPEPTERALVAMLASCIDLMRAAAPSRPALSAASSPSSTTSSSQRKRGLKKEFQRKDISSDDLGANLLQTILQSSRFTSDEVFRIARTVYYNIAIGHMDISGTDDHANPPLPVTNAFLHVCAITGKFDEAWVIMEEMMRRHQGDVKPDLVSYRHVLRAAATRRRQLAEGSTEDRDVKNRVEGMIAFATEALVGQSRIAFWMKLGLGGLAGATVGKFTMMGVMALPYSSIFSNEGLTSSSVGEGRGGGVKEQVMVMDPSQPANGIIHLLASQEIAMGVGLAAGLLTAGYFIRGSTRQPPPAHSGQSVATSGSSSTTSPKSRQHLQRVQDNQLPRAKLFGLYFPDLTTTNKGEIREYLRRCTEP